MEAADQAVAQIDATAFPELSTALHNWPQEVRVGAIYPDWGYLFPDLNAAAEDAHWAPFQTIALQHLHDNYGEPWTEHAEHLFAFICGLGCHGAMDDAWHFGSSSFLQQAISHDLADWSAEDAEAAIEVITDFFVQADLRNTGLEDYVWWLPIDDLLQIHRNAGHQEMSRQAIIVGVNLQRVGLLLEDFLWPIVEPITAPMLPWTRANYLTWHDGGLADGAELSARRFESLWNEYQLISAAHPGGGNVGQPGHRHPSGADSSFLLDLAKQLVDDGLIEIRWKNTVKGAILIDSPVVLDRAEVERRLLKATF